MFMEYMNSAQVRAYALELLVETVRESAATRRERPKGRRRKAFGRALRGMGSLLVRMGERLDARATSTLPQGCG